MNPEYNIAPEGAQQPQTLAMIAKQLVQYRKDHGCSAAKICEMALAIGYESGAKRADADAFMAGYQSGLVAQFDEALKAALIANAIESGEATPATTEATTA